MVSGSQAHYRIGPPGAAHRHADSRVAEKHARSTPSCPSNGRSFTHRCLLGRVLPFDQTYGRSLVIRLHILGRRRSLCREERKRASCHRVGTGTVSPIRADITHAITHQQIKARHRMWISKRWDTERRVRHGWWRQGRGGGGYGLGDDPLIHSRDDAATGA